MKRFFGFLLFILIFPLYSEQILNSDTASWSFVLPGKVICQPENTSYGFITLDQSRDLTAFTENGKKLWSKNIGRGTDPFFTVLPNDFILLINKNGQEMQLINPTGTEIWTKLLNNPVFSKPIAGRDGRFFVKSNSSVSCFGLNGIEKWCIKADVLKEFPMYELEDGSIIVFTKSDTDYSTALRISPFSEIIEKITFEGKITNVNLFNSRLLICYNNNQSALFELKQNKLSEKWKLNFSDEDSFNHQFVSNTNSIVLLKQTKSGIIYSYINPQNGTNKTVSEFKDFKSIKFSVLSDEGLFLADNEKAAFYNFNDKELWNGFYERNRKSIPVFNYLYTKDNNLILFGDDWNVNCFKIIQKTKKNTENIKIQKPGYESFLEIDTSLFEDYLMQEFDTDISSEENLQLLKNGLYGTAEQFWMGKILSGCTAYQNILFTKNSRTGTKSTVFERDNAGMEKMIKHMPLFGTDTFTDFIAYLIKYENNRTMLNTALLSLIDNGYDPNGKILNNLYLLAKRTDIKDYTVSIEICDAVYSICKFMGKSAFNKLGKEIITTFLYPRFNQKTKDYARSTFKKISALDL